MMWILNEVIILFHFVDVVRISSFSLTCISCFVGISKCFVVVMLKLGQ